MRPRRTAFRGRVRSTGLVLDPGLGGEARARPAVLAAWQPGSTLHQAGPLWVLRWPAEATVDPARAPGSPLVAQGELWATLPLEGREHEPFAPGALVVARAGEAVAVELEEALDPAAWLELEPHFIETLPPGGQARLARCSEPPPLALAPIERAAAEAPLGASLGPPPEARDQLLQALRERAGGRDLTSTAAASPAAPRGWWRLYLRLVVALASALGLVSSRSGPSEEAGVGPAVDGAGAEPGPPPAWRRWLRQLLDRVMTSSGLARALGRQHARYLRHMVRLFEEGQLDEALRHAIPAGELERASRGSSWDLLRPRRQLALEPARPAVGGLIGLADDDFSYLRGLYRRAFERLSTEGRIEQAAYVLLQLLAEELEAVDFLERHGRLRLAAEIAEARGLAPGLVVRLWLLAGDPERAVLVARRTGAFADAVLRLEQAHPELAARLRLLWGDQAASAGDFVTAVHAVEPLAEAAGLASAWTARGLALGGIPAAELLARQLARWPGTFEAHRPAIEALLGPDGSAPLRAALAYALMQQSPGPAVAAAARLTLRALLGDLERSPTEAALRAFQRLRQSHGDPLLAADLPALPPARPPSPDGVLLHREAHDTGALPVHDAALLSGGRLAVALGEAGLWIYPARRRGVRPGPRRIDVPAVRLVPSDSGHALLAGSPLGPALWQLRAIDVLAGRSGPRFEVTFDQAADSCDGNLWFVARGTVVLALDVPRGCQRALWRVDTGMTVRSLHRLPDALAIWCQADGEDQLWIYELPVLALRERLSVEQARSRRGALWCVQGVWNPDGGQHPLEVRVLESVGDPGQVSEVWLRTSRLDAQLLVSPEQFQGQEAPRGRVLLQAVTRGQARLTAHHWVVSDDRGRVLVIDTADVSLLEELRIR